MKVEKDEWYYKALRYLKDKKFTNRSGIPGQMYCCLKLRVEDGGMPKEFGIVYDNDNTTIYYRDKEGHLSGVFFTFSSVEALLDFGWDID